MRNFGYLLWFRSKWFEWEAVYLLSTTGSRCLRCHCHSTGNAAGDYFGWDLWHEGGDDGMRLRTLQLEGFTIVQPIYLIFWCLVNSLHDSDVISSESSLVNRQVGVCLCRLQRRRSFGSGDGSVSFHHVI